MSLDSLLMYWYVKKYVRLLCLRSLCNNGSILFRPMPNGNYLFNSASLSLVGYNSLAHRLKVMAAIELHLNAIFPKSCIKIIL